VWVSNRKPKKNADFIQAPGIQFFGAFSETNMVGEGISESLLLQMHGR
jgi:hypothetical protein